MSKNKAGDIRESFKDGDMDKSGMSPSRVELKLEEGKIPPKVSASQGKLVFFRIFVIKKGQWDEKQGSNIE